MAVTSDKSFIDNTYEADILTATAQKVAVDAEILFRSTAALIALQTALATKILEAPKQQTYIQLHDGVAVA